MKIENCKLKISNKAFTLIELLVAIAIVGILAAVVMVSMSSYGAKARASRAMAQASSVIPSMVSCAGNGGTPIFSGNICSVITGAANYGVWPTFPGDYAVASSSPTPDWTSSSNWVFKVSSTTDSQSFCCNSAMNSCGQPTTCNATATW